MFIDGNKPLQINDNLNSKDLISFNKPSVLNRTKILGGYDFYKDRRGVSQLGEVLFEEENQIVLGGALFILEKIFNTSAPISTGYLNDIMGVATYEPVTTIYPKDTAVCLFGVGIGGASDNIAASVNDVKFYENNIVSMVPLRQTSMALTSEEAPKYWFKKLNPDGTISYYLKKFETNPEIKVLWKDAEGDEDGTAVEAGVENTSRTEPIETFVELILKISKKDVREYFELNGNISQARINSIGLFTGIPGLLADGTSDYKQVKMFSKLNIPNEMLVLSKDLTIIYRIYTS